ncbi:hypothetical protein [Winogradskyella sp.]|uniref:hypothetical protein n=1 Tax=Winogradskyella sp. TaxID=1883156 RepID=UPI001B081636|nr:hypothetical protein [Winogradskyella sp.]MBO6881089.1 response regulator transcription factor [Winogradskyella sp.]
MQKEFNVLIVEHEGLLVDVLKNAFASLSTKGKKFNLKIANSCNTALRIMESNTPLDFALLNINIPPCENKKLLFIEDISLKLRFAFPRVKIIVFSSYKNNTYLHSLFKTLNPECLLVKSDINYGELLNAIETVITEPPYYSKTVLRYMRRRIANNMVVDNIDKAILHYLSIGTKMKDLPKFIHLSKSAIESRKRRLKEVFGVEKKGDYHLIHCAEEKGFI